MPRVVCFNDPHYSRHAPECRFKDYYKQILTKLHNVARLAERLKAQAILCSGDWFHRKGKVTYKEQTNLLTVLSNWRKRGFEVAGILGNHDIAGHDLDALNNRAVGALVQSGALQLLDWYPLSIQDDEGALWITGTSYFHGCDANDDNRVRMYGSPGEKPEGSVHVHIAHGTLRQSGSFFDEYTEAEVLVELLDERGCCPDVIVCGHLHFDEGIVTYRTSGGRRVTVCRVGSLGRVSRDDLTRQPKAVVIAARQGQWVCKAHPIGRKVVPQKPEGKKKQEVDKDRIEEFVRILREEADALSMGDHRMLLQRVVDEIGYGTDIFDTALKAVEKHQ